MINKHYKYIHVLWSNELKFNVRMIKLVNEANDVFNKYEHCFVTTIKTVYEAIKDFDNVVYIESKKDKSAKLINDIAPYADYLFLHNICGPNELVKIKTKNMKKIIIRYWGGLTLNGYTYLKAKSIKDLAKNVVFCFINKLMKYKLKNVKAIGVANIVDELEISKKYDSLPYFAMNYTNKEYSNLVGFEAPKKIDRKAYNILVGHSGFSVDNHINIIKSFDHLKNSPIVLYIMVPYGDEQYIEKVKEYCKQVENECVIVDKLIPYEEYVNFLRKMDAAVLDSVSSTALGNVGMLLKMNKKIFLNKDGVIAEAFDVCGLPYTASKDISNMTYEELIATETYDEETVKGFITSSYEDAIIKWKNLLDYLEG